MRSPVVTLLFTAAATASLVGCARVAVNKVPTPAQYVFNGKSEWTKEMQEAADKMEGFRFYLPRPYINVFESFPVTTDIYLASGRVSPDGRFVAIDSIMPLSTADDFGSIAAGNVRTLPESMKVPQQWIYRPGAVAGPSSHPDMQGGDARAGLGLGEGGLSAASLAKIQDAIEESRENAAKAEKQSADAKNAAVQASAAAGDAKESAKETTGQNRRKVTNDNGAFAYQPLRGNFDLVYLPDFDEQYVVSSQSRLGNAEFQMNLGQGWSLQGFNSFTDNSALTKRIFDVIDTGLELAKAAAKAGALAAGVPLPGDARAAVGTPADGDALKEAAGTPVALKIVVVHYAAKGLYPVIKPRELIDASPSAIVLDLAATGGPRPQRAGEINAPASYDLQTHIEKRSTVPVYPYQYVSFNTFRYMAIEALTPQGSPFGTLYDKTGTTGDAGDRRGTDPTRPPIEPTWPSAALSAAVDVLEADAITVASNVIKDVLKDTSVASRPQITSIDLICARGDAGSNVISGTIKWTGTGEALTEPIQAKIKAAIGELVEKSEAVKKANGGTALKLSETIAFSRVVR